MMPTFPSSPLKFRTAGFPRYGFKASYQRAPSLEWHPRVVPSRFTARLRAHRCSVSCSAQCRSTLCAQAPPFKRLRRSTPGALAPVRVLLSRSIVTYPAPSAPLAGTARFHCVAAYTPCLRCAFPPRRPTTGSVLSLLILSQHVALYDSGESSGCMHPVPSPPTLAFVSSAQTRHSQPSANPFHAGVPFGASLRFACATTC